MKYFYGKFISLFPLGLGVCIILIGMESETTVKLTPGIEISKEVLIDIGLGLIALALAMAALAKYVELAMFKLLNLILPEAFRIELKSPAPGQRDASVEKSLEAEQKILKQGKRFEVSTDSVLTSHIFTLREGFFCGALCLVLMTGDIAASLTFRQFPDNGLVALGLLVAGFALLSKRTDILIDPKAGVLRERRKLFGGSSFCNKDFQDFDRIIIKKRAWFGLSTTATTIHPRSSGFGVIYIVQLRGYRLKTVNFYRNFKDAQELVRALAEATRLPVLEAL